MGLDIGLGQAGLDVVIAQDYDRWCAETIRRNGHEVVEGDIRALVHDDPQCNFLLKPANLKRKDVFAVVGGPPCQSFSTAGKRKGTDDERGSLYQQFVHVVGSLRPRFFIMENVRGLLSMPSDPANKDSRPLLEVILKDFGGLGYKVVHGLVNAVDYGVPQFRERLVIIGSRDGEEVFVPSPTHYQRHQEPAMRWRTLRDAIGDVAKAPGASAKFSPNLAKYLKMVPEGGNWRSLPKRVLKTAMGGAYASGGGKVGFYRRLNFAEPSPTLVTSPIQKATLLCHPKEDRPLSVREYAKIQQFPDSWVIEGNVNECYRQIGNAVPVGLGRAIGQMLVSVAEGNNSVKTRRSIRRD